MGRQAPGLLVTLLLAVLAGLALWFFKPLPSPSWLQFKDPAAHLGGGTAYQEAAVMTEPVHLDTISTPDVMTSTLVLGQTLSTAISASVAARDLQTQQTTCKLQGAVDECCNCTYQAVDQVNQQYVHPVLSELVQTAFFRYFKVNIYCDCPLWPDDSMCSLQACGVCECDSAEVPQTWLDQESKKRTCDTTQCAAELDSRVNSTVEPAEAARLLNLQGWRGFNNPWMAEGDEDEEYLYINLQVNPERYTGYVGEHAHRIWHNIYSQSCFNSINCAERRIFYRLISGMHTSISLHISANYLLDEEGASWGTNITDFKQRLGSPAMRDRVQNLYFAYLFVLRAVMKAGPLLQRYSYVTGLAQEDALAARLVDQLVTSQELAAACPMPFDEGRLWKGSDGLALKEELRVAFQNITRVMDCVGCEKCKLWGKLQTLGIATALKILFSSSDCSGTLPSEPPFDTLALERNELIALVNLLERFSKSLEYYSQLSAQLQRQEAGTHLAVEQQEPVF